MPKKVEPPHGWLHAMPKKVEPPHGWLHAVPEREAATHGVALPDVQAKRAAQARGSQQPGRARLYGPSSIKDMHLHDVM